MIWNDSKSIRFNSTNPRPPDQATWFLFGKLRVLEVSPCTERIDRINFSFHEGGSVSGIGKGGVCHGSHI